MILFKKFLRTAGKFLLYLFISLFLALVIRLFLCNFYRVPSDSMAPAVMPGDFILTNKWTYGARIFTNLDFDKNSDPGFVRMPGTGRIKRNDVLVFNFPYRSSWDTVRMNLNKFFVKRCVGLPGDTISIVEGFYRIAGLTDTVGNIPEQKRLIRFRDDLASGIRNTFPFSKEYVDWDVLNFGPMYIPAAGAAIKMTPENFQLYRKQIVYETDARVVMKDSSVYINDKPVEEYIFHHNWYFVAGDNVMNSQDSRYLSLIPEDFIIGKASRVMSSKDPYTGKRKWNRMLKKIE